MAETKPVIRAKLKRGKRLSPVQLMLLSAQVANMVEDGMPDYKIALAVGVGRKRVRRFREEHELPPASTRGSHENALRSYAELVPWVEYLAAKGFGDRAIGKEMGQSRHRVKRIRETHNIPPGGVFAKGTVAQS